MRMDDRKLSPSRLEEIRAAPRPPGGPVDELLDHVAALDEEAQLLGQYYEEFLIPEVLRGGWATAEDQRRDLQARGLHGPWGRDVDDDSPSGPSGPGA